MKKTKTLSEKEMTHRLYFGCYKGDDIKQTVEEILGEIEKIKTATYNWKFLDRAKQIIRLKIGEDLLR